MSLLCELKINKFFLWINFLALSVLYNSLNRQPSTNQSKNDFKVIYDQQGSIGKRYYRQDEAGTPFGITVDHQSIQDDTVTIRYRDTQKQDRLSIAEIKPLISNSINTI
mgnify:CR=1 FL=1